MASQNRRNFLKTAAFIGASAASISSVPTKAKTPDKLRESRMGVLVDTTVCIGCRNCEWIH